MSLVAGVVAEQLGRALDAQWRKERHDRSSP
jgi:hypothetical protein